MKSRSHNSGNCSRARPTRSRRRSIRADSSSHTRAALQPAWQLGGELFQADDTMHVAAERQVEGLDQDVLGAQAQDGVGVRTAARPRVIRGESRCRMAVIHVISCAT